ncbi:MAG: heavy-metal-associated domain-containing protein [Cyanobacteria bacterium]|nr:heavy-metal-associated domain-containing protein [Cyanobacteriota bacterium]MDW8202757.1 heavy-metal-associated domain-containing protein [Cyanobacteriota bacterium SKYGB_h_bin112]
MALKFAVPDMACGACANTITQAIHAIDPKATVTADVVTKQVTVETQEAGDAIKQAIVSAGYTIA